MGSLPSMKWRARGGARHPIWQKRPLPPKIGARRGSTAGRRLVILCVADVRAPSGALTLLAGFRERQMREQPIGRSAMPMHSIRRDIDRVSRVQHLRFFSLEADAADAGQTKERL